MKHAQRSLEGRHTVDEALKILGTHCQTISLYLNSIRPSVLVGIKASQQKISVNLNTPSKQEVLSAEEDFIWGTYDSYRCTFSVLKEPCDRTAQFGILTLAVGIAGETHDELVCLFNFRTGIRNGRVVVLDNVQNKFF